MLVDFAAAADNSKMPNSLAVVETSKEEFRERREQAKRSGNPAWLWPEITISDWAEATTQMSEAVAGVLAGRIGALPPSEPMALSLACYTSGVGPLLGYWLEGGQLEAADDVRDLLALHLDHARRRSATIEAQSRAVVEALVASGVPLVVLKGGHTAYAYFPEPATRPVSDLDLLVPPDFSAQAEVAIAKYGLACAARGRRDSTWTRPDLPSEPRSVWLVHADDPWSVDLHSSLDFSASPGAPLVRFDSADPIGTSDPWPLDSEAGALSQPLLLLHLATHASGGLHSLTLLRMVEIVLVVRRDTESGRLSWDEFLQLGAATGALGAAYPALRMAEKLAPRTIPSAVLDISTELVRPRARKIVDKLVPATAQRIGRASIAEHFMWVGGFSGWCRQLASDVAPGSQFWSIYERRAYQMLRGQLSR
jgi:hypothetical protein